MAIQLNCTGCGKQFRIKEQFRGTKLKCPNCKQELIVQGPHVHGYEVFVSYSSKDKQVADAVCAAMESKGVRCWIAPRDIPAGASWGAAIIEGMEDSRTLVLVFSAHSNTSDQVLREIERAVAKKIPILPLRIDDTRMGKSLEYFLGACHWMNATDGPLEKHLSQLTSTVRMMLLDRAAAEEQGVSAAGEPPLGAPAGTTPPPAAPPRPGGVWKAGVAVAVVALAVAVGIVLAARGGRRTAKGAGPMTAPATAPSAVVPPPATQAADEKWIDLFNGTDFAGWQIQRSRLGLPKWVVREGLLVGSGVNGFLVSQSGSFADFHLRAEVMINDGGNAGLMFRVQGEQPLMGGAYEAQIHCSGPDPVKTGGAYGYFPGRNHPTLAVVPTSPVAANQWFTLEVIGRGSKFRILVNGKQTAEFEDSHYLTGGVAIRNQGPGTHVTFRKLQIRKLSSS